MKTIRLIATTALAGLSLATALHAQDIRDLEKLRDAERPGTQDDWEAQREMLQDRARREMMFPDKVRQPLERRRAEMKLEELKQPDSQEIQVGPQWRIGVMVEPLDPFVRMHLGLPEDAGVRVSHVQEGEPAAQAGIEVNDIIVVAGDRKIGNLDALRDVVERSGKEGRPVALQIIHKGERKPVKVAPLGPKPERDSEEARPQPERDQGRPFVDIQRRLEHQEKMIQELRAELKRLRKQIEADEREDKDDDEDE
jgi:hypothetical protein